MEKERAREIYENIKKEGLKAIDDYIVTRQPEELFLDFKRSGDNGAGRTLHQDDRKNYAKAISGFGNSEGGVIIWGVDCSVDCDGADVAKARFPIENVERFLSLLQGAVSNSTIPAHSRVENYGIRQEGKQSGFVVSLIPKSMNAPHQVINNLQYYMRSGSSFSPVPHSVLSGMFGRRPQPKVFLMFTNSPPTVEMDVDGVKTVLCKIGFLITNDGMGIARDTFFTAEVHSIPSKACIAGFEYTEERENWIGNFAFDYKLSIICKPDYRIAPRSYSQPIIFHLRLKPPLDSNLKIVLKCGCEGGEHFDYVIYNTPENILSCYHEMIKATDAEVLREYNGRVFSIKDIDTKK